MRRAGAVGSLDARLRRHRGRGPLGLQQRPLRRRELHQRPYRGWVEEDARNEATNLTAADAALRFTVEPSPDDEGFTLKASTVRVWGSKGDVRKRGVNHHGMTLYDVADIERRIERQMAAREVVAKVAEM